MAHPCGFSETTNKESEDFLLHSSSIISYTDGFVKLAAKFVSRVGHACVLTSHQNLNFIRGGAFVCFASCYRPSAGKTV